MNERGKETMEFLCQGPDLDNWHESRKGGEDKWVEAREIIHGHTSVIQPDLED